MNATKLSVLSFAVAACVGLIQMAQAQDNTAAAPASRAEVLADLQVWRESGLAEVQTGESASDPTRNEYIAALNRYSAMRASPDFAQRVARIEREQRVSSQVAKQ
jgi:hypothetical protein